MKQLFVIASDEDGPHIEAITAEELIKRLNEEYWGKRGFLRVLPREYDDIDWSDILLIIRGEIVAPKAVQKVTEWEIDS